MSSFDQLVRWSSEFGHCGSLSDSRGVVRVKTSVSHVTNDSVFRVNRELPVSRETPICHKGLSACGLVLDIWNKIFISEKMWWAWENFRGRGKVSRAWENFLSVGNVTCIDDSDCKSLQFWPSHWNFESRVSSNVVIRVRVASCSCLSDSWPSVRESFVWKVR